MNKQTRALLLALIILALFLAACSNGSSSGSTTQEATLDGATLLQERCAVCHPLSRVTAKHLSSDEWKSVVDSMVKRGANLTPDEQTILIDYLAANLGK